MAKAYPLALMKVESPRAPLHLSPALCVFAAVLLVRLIVLQRFAASAFLLPNAGDMHFYNDWALRILRGQWSDGHAFYGLPLYPFLLAALYAVFGFNPYLPGLLQACADSGTAVLLFQLGREIFADKASPTTITARPFHLSRGEIIGLLAAIGWAFFLPAQAYSAVLMPTALATFVFWFVVWQMVRSSARLSRLKLFGLGLLIGFTAMGVATVLFTLPLVFAKLLLNSSRRSMPWRATFFSFLLLGAGLALGTAPCWLHNRFFAHDPVLLSAHSGVNFWIGNNPHATGYPRFPPGLHAGQEAMLEDSIRRAEQAAGHPLARSEVSRYWSEQATAYIRQHPARWLALLATKIGNFWNAFQYDDLSIITNLRANHVILPGLLFGLIATLALTGALLAGGRITKARWLIAAILLHNASLLTVFVTERYRLAAVPGLLLLAVFGLVHFWENVVNLRPRRLLTYSLLLCLSLLFVSRPQKDPALWALDPYNSGWQALEAKDLPLARQKLSLAYSYVPTNAEVNFALGNLSLEEGNRADARLSYLTVLQLDPTHEGAWNNLGVLALEDNQPEQATSCFRKALEQNPRDAKSYFLLARAFLDSGDPSSAGTTLNKALQLKPDQPEFVALRDEIVRKPHPL